MTFFLTGIYPLPEQEESLQAPEHAHGAAEISYATDEHLRTP